MARTPSPAARRLEETRAALIHALQHTAGADLDPAIQAAQKLLDQIPSLVDSQDEVTVDVLGRIFECSHSDIEEIKAKRLEPHEAGRRKVHGIFYTDAAIAAHLVGAALEPAWERQRARLIAEWGPGDVLPDPPPATFSRAMLTWLEALTVCDPACGSGVFLVAAYDWFEERRCGLLDDLRRAEPAAPECHGGLEDWRVRSAPVILRNNLFGVDLAPEAVEIARLSLWIRTAHPGQPQTDLSANVLCGNSVVDDPAVDARAFDWRARFPQVFERGGFVAVVGNPPYVRHELLGPIKPYLGRAYPKTYHGMADLYVFFHELGLRLLKPGGRLAFVVTNKWMKASYGAPLRRLFGAEAWVETVVDFGHARPFFKDADVFPCFLVARKPTDEPRPETARVCVIPREIIRTDDLKVQIASHGVQVERDRFGEGAWLLGPRAVADLLTRIRARGIPLAEYAGVRPRYGIKTGLNKAFLIDTPRRDSLVAADPKAAEIIKPYLRGQDVERWHADWAGLWMIALPSSSDHPWPWSEAGAHAEALFTRSYPSLHAHLKTFEEDLVQRQDQGRYWWELRPCAYWAAFDNPKILYRDITWKPSYCLDREATLTNDTAFFLPKSDDWILAVLNSPLLWWYSWRKVYHGKDEALRMKTIFVADFPIAPRVPASDEALEPIVRRLAVIAESEQTTRRELLDWLEVQYEVADPGDRLQDPAELVSDAFVAEVQKRRGKQKTLTAAAVRGLREEYTRSIEPARQLAAEARALERQLSALVNAAYGLTPDEVRLLWDTAPPRMPIARPTS